MISLNQQNIKHVGLSQHFAHVPWMYVTFRQLPEITGNQIFFDINAIWLTNLTILFNKFVWLTNHWNKAMFLLKRF